METLLIKNPPRGSSPFKTSLEEWKHGSPLDGLTARGSFKTSLEEWKHQVTITGTLARDPFKTSLEEWKPETLDIIVSDWQLLKLP